MSKETPYIIQNRVKEILDKKMISPKFLQHQMNERGIVTNDPRFTNIIHRSGTSIKFKECLVICDILGVTPLDILPKKKGFWYDPKTQTLHKNDR